MLLIVEDDQAIVDFVEFVASDFFESIHHAKTIAEVEENLHQNKKFRLAIVDLNLNGESGVEVIKLIKDYSPNLPIIVTSGLFEKSFVEKHQGHIGLLEKPFKLGELKKIIQERMISKEKKEKKKEKDQSFKSTDFMKKLTGKG